LIRVKATRQNLIRSIRTNQIRLKRAKNPIREEEVTLLVRANPVSHERANSSIAFVRKFPRLRYPSNME
jgi:hypothetical protein